MNKNRKKIEEHVLKFIDKIIPDNINKELYIKLFKKTSDVEFHNLMLKLKSGKLILPIIVANDASVKLSTERNFKVAKELGVEFFQQSYNKSVDGKIEYLTPQKNLVFDLPVRRASQTLLKGLSTATSSKKRNPITGQASGDSSAAKITMPELQILQGLGLEKTMMELMSVRGGNTVKANARRAYIHKYGIVRQSDLDKFPGESGSTTTLRAIFKAAHIKMKG